MSAGQPFRIKTISQYHEIMGLPKPEHPLITLVDLDEIKKNPESTPVNVMFDFYSISSKKSSNVKYKYGQQEYDFEEGILFFMAPNQVFGVEADEGAARPTGWLLLIHPDFLWNTPLAKTITKYDYFDYSVNEALFLSEKEETTIKSIVQNIKQEYHTNIDNFSQDIIISQLETLLNYAERFYQRQFITRKKANHKILHALEKLLNDYFKNEDLIGKGLPNVQWISEKLNISPTYLRSLLKHLTGLSTQQHIHEKLIEKAKEKLSTSNLSVSEISYQLGFEHPQSFSKLFKTKTKLSPLEFRASFN